MPGGTTTVDRIDYSNDTATATPKGPLSVGRFGMGATGDQSFGYFVGGKKGPDPGSSTIDRIDYSNDTATAVAKGPLSIARRFTSSLSSRANALPTTSPHYNQHQQ